jgi:hypothetical protein
MFPGFFCRWWWSVDIEFVGRQMPALLAWHDATATVFCAHSGHPPKPNEYGLITAAMLETKSAVQ